MSESVLIRLKEDGPPSFRHSSGAWATQDDPEVEVDPQLAEYLTAEHPFVKVSTSADTESDADDNSAEPVVEADSQEPSVDSFDAAEFFEEHDHWREAQSAIEDGEVDDHLEEVEAEENARGDPRDSVMSAIEERQEQLSGEDSE